MVKRKSTPTRWASRKRQYKVPRAWTSDKMHVLSTNRTVDMGAVTVTASNIYGALEFKVSNLLDSSDFNIFDEYMIKFVTCMFVPDFNSNVMLTSTTQWALPHFLTAIDYNDAVTPTSEDQLLNNESCIIHTPGRRVNRTVIPKVAVTYWQTSVASGFGSESHKWIDTNSLAVSHYGLKYMIKPDADTQAETLQYRLFIKYGLAFRKVI